MDRQKKNPNIPIYLKFRAEHDGDIHFFVRLRQSPPPPLGGFWGLYIGYTPIFEITFTENGPKNHFFYIGGG